MQPGSFFLSVFFLPEHDSFPPFRDFREYRTDRKTLQRQSGQLTPKTRSRRGNADRSQPPSWPGRTGKHHKDPPSYQPLPPGHFCCTAKVRALSTGNTIEGGLMEIKTPYRIPYVSQMAALDGVSYKHQPSLGFFTCFFPDGPPQPIGEKRRFFATVTVC